MPDPSPTADALAARAAARLRARAEGDAVLVQTDVLLPNRRGVVAVVERGSTGTEITVSDGGLALGQLGEHGLDASAPALRAARHAARRWGLVIEGGALRTAPVPPDDMDWAIAQLANGAREVAAAALDAARCRSPRRRPTMPEPIQDALAAAARALCCGAEGCCFGGAPDTACAAWIEDRARAARAIAAFLRTPGLSAALHALMQRPENAGKTWAEVLAEAVERGDG